MNIYSGLVIHIPAQNMHSEVPATVQNGASSFNVSDLANAYTKEINCVATAYTASAADNPWGPVDYFGNPLKLGTVAVDPSVIPLGSTVYIVGYNFNGLPTNGMVFHADDEGGAIKGNRVDFVFTHKSGHR